MRVLIPVIFLIGFLCLCSSQAESDSPELTFSEDYGQMIYFVCDVATASDLSPLQLEYSEPQAQYEEIRAVYKEKGRVDEFEDLLAECEMNAELRPLICGVTKQEGSAFPIWITIDKGAADGVEAGMAVVYRGAFVGIITQTETHSAVVRTIFHPDFICHCLVSSEAANSAYQSASGIAKHSQCAENNIPDLRMDVSADDPVQIGDTVLTFDAPSIVNGIPLGTVAGITENGSSQCITIIPAADFEWLPYVIVLRCP